MKINVAIGFFCVSTASCSSSNLVEVASDPNDCEFIAMVWAYGEDEEKSMRNLEKTAAEARGNTLVYGWPNSFNAEQRRVADERFQTLRPSGLAQTAIGSMYFCENAHN